MRTIMAGDPFLQGIIALRLLSATAELTGAYFMFRLGRLEDAVRINALLGVVGPAVLMLATAVGVAGLADRLPLSRLALVLLGAAIVAFATRTR